MVEGNSEETVFIGDFEIPLSEVQATELPVNKDALFEIKKIERKTYTDKDTNKDRAFYSVQLGLVDYPGEVIFHTFWPDAQSLRSRHAHKSIPVFLDTLGLERSLEVFAGLANANTRFVGQLYEDKKRDEYKLSKVVGAAS